MRARVETARGVQQTRSYNPRKPSRIIREQSAMTGDQKEARCGSGAVSQLGPELPELSEQSHGACEAGA
jgi:hypothetical protein